MSKTFIHHLEQTFTKAANPNIATKQSAYLRDLYPFLGIKKPVQMQLEKEIFKQYPLKEPDQLEEVLFYLWKKEEREYQYTAMHLAKHYRKFSTATDLGIYEWMIRNKSWWDTVDEIASNLVGSLVIKYPELLKMLDQWIEDPDLWIRRSALIFQLKWKEKTDEKRLFNYCEQTMHEKEFFMRKAIGWALRQHSKIDPKTVAAFIHNNHTHLSPLSIREATKYL